MLLAFFFIAGTELFAMSYCYSFNKTRELIQQSWISSKSFPLMLF